ncbi:MAG: hypothetical protein H6644_21595 [Caldilineaceae bacterium]|nr:hypothetical protein [Caldilineaceae bacterium]
MAAINGVDRGILCVIPPDCGIDFETPRKGESAHFVNQRSVGRTICMATLGSHWANQAGVAMRHVTSRKRAMSIKTQCLLGKRPMNSTKVRIANSDTTVIAKIACLAQYLTIHRSKTPKRSIQHVSTCFAT